MKKMTDESLKEEILINVTPSEVRAALRAAHTLVNMGLFPRVVPYYYLIFRTDTEP